MKQVQNKIIKIELCEQNLCSNDTEYYSKVEQEVLKSLVNIFRQTRNGKNPVNITWF